MKRIDGRDAPEGYVWCYLCAERAVPFSSGNSGLPEVCVLCRVAHQFPVPWAKK